MRNVADADSTLVRQGGATKQKASYGRLRTNHPSKPLRWVIRFETAIRRLLLRCASLPTERYVCVGDASHQAPSCRWGRRFKRSVRFGSRRVIAPRRSVKTLFLCPLRIERHAHNSRTVQRVRHARVSRIPGHYGPREHLTLQIRALHVRIHTLTLKFLQGHT